MLCLFLTLAFLSSSWLSACNFSLCITRIFPPPGVAYYDKAAAKSSQQTALALGTSEGDVATPVLADTQVRTVRGRRGSLSLSAAAARTPGEGAVNPNT